MTKSHRSKNQIFQTATNKEGEENTCLVFDRDQPDNKLTVELRELHHWVEHGFYKVKPPFSAGTDPLLIGTI